MTEKKAKKARDCQGANMGGIGCLFNDTEMIVADSYPDVAAIFKDIPSNPANIRKYESSSKLMALVT